MPKGKKEALKEQLGEFESFITKQKQISKSLQDDKIDISNEKLWENINGVNKENRVNWFKPDNLKILVKDSKARNQKEGQNLTIADAKENISKISNDDRLKAYAVGIVNCIKAKFLDGNTYDSKGKQWDDILKDLTDNIKNLNEIQDQLTKNSDKLKPGLFGKIVGRIKNWVASSPKEVRDIKCQDDETVYKKLESIIGQKNKLLDCGDKGKGAIEAQIKWRNGKQEMSDSQKEFWLNKGNSALLENLGKLKFEESKEIKNFLEELKKIAGYNDGVYGEVNVSDKKSVGNFIINCLVHMSSDLKEAEEKLKGYGTFDEKTKTFTFNENVTEITADIAKSLPEGVENLVGDSVQTIGENAFMKRSALTEVRFEAATKIEPCAFYDCRALREANIPNATTIGYCAFDGCIALEKAEFKAAKTIGISAFSRCKKLKTAEFRAATTIGYGAFDGCIALGKAEFNAATTIGYGAFAGCIALGKAEFNAATTIGGRAFSGCIALEKAEFNAATTIGECAFDGCAALEKAEFNAVTTIGISAFSRCKKLTTANFESNEVTIGDNAFRACTALTTANIPNATTIGDGAFYNCSSLETAKFNAATTIGNIAFAYCEKLTTANIPNATTIGENAFLDCNALNEVDIPNVTIDERAFFGSPVFGRKKEEEEERLRKEEERKKLEEYGALSDNQETFTFNDSVTKITEYIAKILPNGVKNLVGDKVQTIEKSVFSSRKKLKTATFNAATTIGYGAFCDCIALEKAEFKAATTIGKYAFYGCIALEKAEFNAVTTIGDGAFYNCSSLETAKFNAATTIGKSAFTNCEKLTTANFPNVQTIGDYAFFGCPILERLRKEEEEEEKEYKQAFNDEADKRTKRKDSWKRTITHAPKRAVRTVKSTFKSVVNKILGKEEEKDERKRIAANKRKIKSAFQKVGKYFVTDTGTNKKLFGRKEMKNKIGEDVKKICLDWYNTLAISLKDEMMKKVKLSGASAWLYGDGTADEKDKKKLAKIKKAKSLAILLISLRGLCDEQGNCYAESAIEGLKDSGGFTSSLQSSYDICERVAAAILINNHINELGQLSSTGTEIIKTIIDSSSVKLVSMPFDKLAAKAEA